MDEHVRDDIAAATAAHQELGREYDAAVAAGLIEQIGMEIDKRVDARVASGGQARRRPIEITEPGDKRRAMLTGLAVGAGAVGIPLSYLAYWLTANGSRHIALAPPHGGWGGQYVVTYPDFWPALLGIWSVIAVVYVVYFVASRRRFRA